MRRLIAIPLVFGLLACDSELKDTVADLESKVEALETEQRVAAKEAGKVREQLEAADASRAGLQREVVARGDEIRGLEEKVISLEEKLQVKDPKVRPGRPDPALRYRVEVGSAHARGPADAKITVVEFSDFQCPFCKRVNPALNQLRKDYGRDLRIVFRHNPLPFHKRAMDAAIAAEAAGRQGKFWEMHDKLFDNSRDLTDSNFVKWAKELKLDVRRFKDDIADTALRDKITGDQRDGNAVGARGTPAFFINGRFLSGAQPVASFKKLIDEELREADRLILRGTAKSRVYEELMRSAKRGV